MSKKLRVLGSFVLGIGFAIALAVQSASMVSVRTDPAYALQIDPDNGRALGKYALGLFSAAAQEGTDIGEAAKSAEGWAYKGYQVYPLNPEALAVLAMAQDNVGKKRAILTEASKLNRRSLSLQGLALQMHVEGENIPAAVATLDQILRVHPERSEEFFPVLAGALSKEEVIPSFVEILADEPPWQEGFLRFAALQPDAVRNAAKLRTQIASDDPIVSQQMITGLVAAGDLTAAREHYLFAKKAHPREAGNWSSEFPPFDWKFADTRDMRAQVSRDGAKVDLFVKSGNGGVVMERLLAPSQSAFSVEVDADIRPAGKDEDVRVQVTCAGSGAGSGTALLDMPLSEQGSGFPVPAPAADCGDRKLAIYARAWRGQASMRGTIESITIRSN